MTTNRWFRLAMLLSVFLIVPLSGMVQQEKIRTPSEKMDELFDFWNRLDQPGFAVVVVKDGRVAYQKTFGLACLEQPAPNTSKTVFHVINLAMPVTAMAVAMLEKQGKLSLDDDVRKYIPEVPDFGLPIKLRHLLYHSSGLRDWISVLALMGTDKEEVTFNRILSAVKTQKRPASSPGGRFLFSNTNYDLLAETVKRVTGKPLADWTWENIFKPLKMTRTRFRGHCREVMDNQAFSYNYDLKDYLKGMDNLSAAGSFSLFSNLEDLGKWLLNLETGQVGGKDVVEKIFTAGKLDNGSVSAFGGGVYLSNLKGMRRGSLSGNWAGSGASLQYFPDQKFGFIVLANWDYTMTEGFVPGIIDIYMPPVSDPEKKTPPVPAKKEAKIVEAKVSTAVLDRYAGEYRAGPRTIYAISRDGKQLLLGVGGSKYALTPLSETEFLLSVADIRLTFQKNKEGEVSQFVWNQEGVVRSFPKIKRVNPNPQQLQEYGGIYDNEDLNIRCTVELQDDKIVLILPGQNLVRLAPDEKDRFTSDSKTCPVAVFSRNQQNSVTSFIIDDVRYRDLVFKKTGAGQEKR